MNRLRLFLKRLRTWIVEIFRWLWRIRPVWAPVLSLSLLLITACWLPVLTPEIRIRYAGLLLELLGVATVVAGLKDKSRLFNKPTFREYIQASMADFPRWPGANVTATLQGITMSASAGIVGRLSVWSKATDDSIEKRLAALERNIESLKQDQVEAVQSLRKADETLRVDLRKEVAESRAAEQDLRKKVEGLGADGIHIEAIGVLWIVFGTILSTASSELAKLLH